MSKSGNFRKNFRNIDPQLSAKQTLTVAEAALMLGKSEDTITRWCKSGKLFSRQEKYGSRITFSIEKDAVEYFIQKQEQADNMQELVKKPAHARSTVSQKELVEAFRKDALNGLIPGAKKRFSPRTVDHYCELLNKFFKSYDTVSYGNLKGRLSDIEADLAERKVKEPNKQHPDMIESKNKLIKACVCFAKYISQSTDSELVQDLKRISLQKKEKSQIKRSTITAEELEQMLAVCTKTQDKLLITLLASTGLRASEYCDLKVGDLNLEERILTVQNGKGGKLRTVVMTTALVHLIQCYLVAWPKKSSEYLHTDRNGKQMERTGVFRRVQRIGKLAGVPAASHALRRAFVTINANEGRSLAILQKACGHERIQTTMAYCQTSEEEFINIMKDWG